MTQPLAAYRALARELAAPQAALAQVLGAATADEVVAALLLLVAADRTGLAALLERPTASALHTQLAALPAAWRPLVPAEQLLAALPEELPALGQLAQIVQRWQFVPTLRGGAAGQFGPDIFGYLLEMRLNRRGAGAFYTPPDVADYLCRQAIGAALAERAALPLNAEHGISVRSQAHAALSAGSDLITALSAALNRADAAALQRVSAALGGPVPFTVLDPCCGGGALLLAALEALAAIYTALWARAAELAVPFAMPLTAPPEWCAATHLYGADLMPEALRAAERSLGLRLLAAKAQPLPRFNLAHGNALIGGLADQRSPAQIEADLVSSGALWRLPSGQLSTPPLHWAHQFPLPLAAGGFAAVVTNPPYLASRAVAAEYRLVGYRTEPTGNLYAAMIERSLHLLVADGRLAAIVPIASVATEAMQPLVALYAGRWQWHSHYAIRPAQLFPGVDMNLTISLIGPPGGQTYTSAYRRWHAADEAARARLFSAPSYLAYEPVAGHPNPLPKFSAPIERTILTQISSHGWRLGDYLGTGSPTLFVHSGGRYWRKALPEALSSHYRPLCLPPHLRPLGMAIFNSQLFYWYWITNSNCMDLVTRETHALPVFALDQVDPRPYHALEAELLRAYAAARRERTRSGPKIATVEANFDLRQAYPVIAAIDAQLAADYRLNRAQAAFIADFDRPFRRIE